MRESAPALTSPRSSGWRLPGLAIAALLAGAVAAAAATIVPPGNRNQEQPPVPGGSASRTQALKTTYEAKYRKVYKLLANDNKLRAKIRESAAAYGIDPMHIVGAIVGEHTYNVDAYDRLQTYYIKAISYLDQAISFSYGGENVDDFVQRPEFAACSGLKDSYELWTCRESVWEASFRGRNSFPNDRFSAVFFQPFYAGQTFGIGQLNPLTALEMSDYVHRVSGFPRLDASDPRSVYKTIMDPDMTLPYVAATLRKSIDAYKSIAGFDISQNPGLTATLYNLGNPEARARALRAENADRQAQGLEPRLPQENYYGWLVNEKLPELKAVF
ncbi:DUF1402 family protein [Mesorhizobium sp. BAC0120]|uniref:DUF1402 family protein n=1 Tax=Mesorhizobium sp. BAC0120 TaxID=3090670 RepID=UPI00298BD1C6|nr:DUF1402 family protein [Mesorhizobium sp. BAC0120]MDW6024502.1 DUF1402 family protein [Mesorhizobium sp. BAC0120]